MLISIQEVGKKFNQEWIFREFSHDFASGEAYAILGANGSGKSTLLQVINGSMHATEGSISYSIDNQPIPLEKIYRLISIGLPYQDLIWEFTLRESIVFQRHFKPYIKGLEPKDILDATNLGRHADKPLRYYSSGMKQRVRLALAILADTPVLLLDEPCMNLDAAGRKWYNELLNTFGKGRLTIISSNHMEDEIKQCQHHIDIHQFKS